MFDSKEIPARFFTGGSAIAMYSGDSCDIRNIRTFL